MRILSRFITLLLAMSVFACADIKRMAYDGYDRDNWQQAETVVQKLNIRKGDRIADLGAGGGYFTFYLADATGTQGMVYAVDVDKHMTKYLDKEITHLKYTNIQTLLAEYDDAKLPNGVDLVFSTNTYHHIDKRVAYFTKLKKSLPSKGRLAIIEFKQEGMLGWMGHATPKQTIIDELNKAGFQLTHDFDFLQRQNFLVFTLEQN